MPDIGQGTLGHQVDPGLPFLKGLDVKSKAIPSVLFQREAERVGAPPNNLDIRCFTWNRCLTVGPMFHVKPVAQAARERRRTCLRSATRAAGVTPAIRAAWPKVAGRWAASFWRISAERLPTAS